MHFHWRCYVSVLMIALFAVGGFPVNVPIGPNAYVFFSFVGMLPPSGEKCTTTESTMTIEVNYILVCRFDKIDQQMNWKRNNKMKDSITHGVKGKSMKFHLQAK